MRRIVTVVRKIINRLRGFRYSARDVQALARRRDDDWPVVMRYHVSYVMNCLGNRAVASRALCTTRSLPSSLGAGPHNRVPARRLLCDDEGYLLEEYKVGKQMHTATTKTLSHDPRSGARASSATTVTT